jgi:hypothetical protein
MSRSRLLLTPLFTLLFAIEGLAQTQLSETWQSGYSGADANGPKVLGYWKFAPDVPTADSSGKGHTMTFAGARVVDGGKRDGALESFPGVPVEDKRHAAVVAASPALSPKGAFTAELWMKPGPDLKPALSPVLLDKKYVAHTDYQWRLTAADKAGARRMQVSLGFGDDSETVHSEPFQPGTHWQHVAFTYDGAGEVRFFRNGAPVGIVRKPGRGPIAPGKHVLSIGDRVGSSYAGFPGLLDEVRLCNGALEFRPVAVEFRAERRTWLRMEKAEPVGVTVRNLSKAAAGKLKLRVSVEGIGEKSFDLPALAAGATEKVQYPFDTTLRPDTYQLTAHLEMEGETPFVSEEHAEFCIAARPLPRMPVMMWGIGGPESVRKEMARLKDLGFTHCLGGGADYGAIWAAKSVVPPSSPERIAEEKAMLDFALANDFGIAFALSPGGWLKERAELQRVDRQGKPYATRPDVNAALPGLAEFCFNVGASVAQTYRDFPAWRAGLIDSETRDSSQVSFSEFDREAYRKFSGDEIPAEVITKGGVAWTKLKDFPADRVVTDDHPLLKFYRWFWTVGDGWNALHTAVHRGLHSTGRDDVWTWFDPAIRAPSIKGSGGDVDVLGQWTYTNPAPARIGYFADELLAMTSPRQRAMKMTQLFWYRTQTAPKKDGADHIASPFDDHDPDAAYITISPMHLRESFWTKIARPVSGIMYHGWQALVPTESIGGYRYTHPDTQNEFRHLHRDVLAPLGPTFLALADRPSDVAYLDSFTAQMLAGRGSYGSRNEEAYLTLLHAQLQPQVIFEETLLERGLDGFKVLVLADCDVLPASVARRIREFQQRGGLVIGDENLAPAITAEIRLPKFTFTKKAAEDHATLLANAAKLRAALDARYARHAESTNPEVLVRCRQSGASDYVFVVNDRREAGDYVGQHGLVLENGLPSDGEIRLQRAGGHVFDLVAGREVTATSRAGSLSWPVRLGPCDGNVFLISPQPIARVQIAGPDSAARGAAVKFSIRVANDAGEPVPAAIPTRVEIVDPAGRAAEGSGFRSAIDGRLDLTLELAPNDGPGMWEVRATELASGRSARHFFRVAASPK